MSTPKVSVIVPVYNTAQLVRKCLESIAGQSYQNIEIIIINDGSTDRSDEVIREFIDQEKRAVYISQKNQGVSAARNSGLNRSTGEYIIFCDSDDYFTKDAISLLVTIAKKNKSTITIGGYLKVYGKKKEIIVPPVKKNLNELADSLLKGETHGGLWNKLIRRSDCNEIRFDEGINFSEDLLFLYKLISNENTTVAYVDQVVYNYILRPGSLTNCFSKEMIYSSNQVLEIIVNYRNGPASSGAIKHYMGGNAYVNIVNGRKAMTEERLAVYKSRLKYYPLTITKRLIVWLCLHGLDFPIKYYRHFKSRAL